jgi:hypothetical protein
MMSEDSTRILERLAGFVGTLVKEEAGVRCIALADCLNEVLDAWRYEAMQGDGIMEENVGVYRRARQELCAVRGWGYDPMQIPKVSKPKGGRS